MTQPGLFGFGDDAVAYRVRLLPDGGGFRTGVINRTADLVTGLPVEHDEPVVELRRTPCLDAAALLLQLAQCELEPALQMFRQQPDFHGRVVRSRPAPPILPSFKVEHVTSQKSAPLVLVSCIVVLFSALFAEAQSKTPSVIPAPLSFVATDGTLKVSDGAVISFPANDPESEFAAEFLADVVQRTRGIRLVPRSEGGKAPGHALIVFHRQQPKRLKERQL